MRYSALFQHFRKYLQAASGFDKIGSVQCSLFLILTNCNQTIQFVQYFILLSLSLAQLTHFSPLPLTPDFYILALGGTQRPQQIFFTIAAQRIFLNFSKRIPPPYFLGGFRVLFLIRYNVSLFMCAPFIAFPFRVFFCGKDSSAHLCSDLPSFCAELFFIHLGHHGVPADDRKVRTCRVPWVQSISLRN